MAACRLKRYPEIGKKVETELWKQSLKLRPDFEGAHIDACKHPKQRWDPDQFAKRPQDRYGTPHGVRDASEGIQLVEKASVLVAR